MGERRSFLESDGTPRGNQEPWEPTAFRRGRTVWTINTEPTPYAHFATMPTRLAERCLLAGTRPGDLALDPFFGSGTLGLVALRHARAYLGIELQEDYRAIQQRRLAGVDLDLWSASSIET